MEVRLAIHDAVCFDDDSRDLFRFIGWCEVLDTTSRSLSRGERFLLFVPNPLSDLVRAWCDDVTVIATVDTIAHFGMKLRVLLVHDVVVG